MLIQTEVFYEAKLKIILQNFQKCSFKFKQKLLAKLNIFEMFDVWKQKQKKSKMDNIKFIEKMHFCCDK